MRPYGTVWVGVVLWAYFLLPTHATAVPEPEQLIIFLQPSASAVDKAYQEQILPQIHELANSMGVPVHVVQADKGAPAEIAITPLIVYQNHRGRSVYQGRTTTLKRIRNFIRTSRYVPQGKELNLREHIPIWKNGRTRIWAPLKVAAVTGDPPKDYYHDAFVAEAIKNIKKGFNKFRMQKKMGLGRADRGFYMDFYPWLSNDGTLFLTVAVFSQFYCHAPVFQEKIIGPWKNRKALFRKAATVAEQTVANIINDPQSGDSFHPLENSIPQVSWQKLGFPIPPAPQTKAAKLRIQGPIPRKWILTKSGPADPPMIQFRFPAPLDHYAGEVTSAKGELLLPQSLQLDGAKGFIEVDTRGSITMGEPVLDEVIAGSMFLYVKEYPSAKFVIDSIHSEGQPISYARMTPAGVNGTFILKGKRVSLKSIAEFEPIIDDNENPRLLIRATFNIDLRVFQIEGADGPAPARHTLLFDVNIILKADNET